jgi:hypothetical protein
VALQKQELWRQLRDAEAVSPRPPRRRRLWLIRRTASAHVDGIVAGGLSAGTRAQRRRPEKARMTNQPPNPANASNTTTRMMFTNTAAPLVE